MHLEDNPYQNDFYVYVNMKQMEPLLSWDQTQTTGNFLTATTWLLFGFFLRHANYLRLLMDFLSKFFFFAKGIFLFFLLSIRNLIMRTRQYHDSFKPTWILNHAENYKRNMHLSLCKFHTTLLPNVLLYRQCTQFKERVFGKDRFLNLVYSWNLKVSSGRNVFAIAPFQHLFCNACYYLQLP